MKPLPITWDRKLVPISSLIDFEYNPRTLSVRHHKLLQDSLEEFGLSEKPVVNQDFTIISGHQRIRVLAELGHEDVYVEYPDIQLTDKQVEKLNILLNSIDGDWDDDILGNCYDAGDLLTWGLDEDDLGLGKPEPKEKQVKAIISFEFPDKDTMLEHITTCERIAEESQAKMKVRG
tara:strand:+ start:1624 stop:2151 length:528 start_codon:yes stop_codon:yes gene_type:complete